MNRIPKFARYLLAGSTGAGINFVIYFILINYFNFWYVLASVISFTLSVFAGFYLQKYVTFRNTSQENISKQITYFGIFAVVNLVLNIIFLVFAVEVMGIGTVVSKVLVIGALAVWSYFVYQKHIFV